MAEFPRMPLYTDSILADTIQLTNEQFGAYMRLLIFVWRTPDCVLQDNDKKFATMLSITPRKWAALRPELIPFFRVEDGVWIHEETTKMRQKVAKMVDQKKYAAGQRWRAKPMKTNKRGYAGASAAGHANADTIQNQTDINIREKEPLRETSPSAFAAGVALSELTVAAIKNGDRYLLAQVSPAKARRAVEEGLVTEEECREAGLI